MSNINEKQYIERATLGASSYKPVIRISFHTKDKCYHAFGGEKNELGEPVNPNDQLLSVSTQKTLDTPAGSFTITLVGSQWLKRLMSNDVVVIQMGYAGEKLTTAMVGLIDKVNRRRSMGADGTPTVNTVITGRDFGKLLVKDVLKFYPQINGIGQTSSSFFLTEPGRINLMSVFTSDSIMRGTPAVILDNIMRFIFTKLNNVKWSVYDERGKKKQIVSASQVIRYVFAKIDFFLPFIMTADQFEGALWNMMERASIKPFTELFIDVRDEFEAWKTSEIGRVVPQEVEESSSQNKAKLKSGAYPSPGFFFGEDRAKVVLVLRETPYDSVLRKKLVTHTINIKDVTDEDLSQDDSEHYNLFWAGTTINALGTDLKQVCPPLFNETNARRYGLSPLEVEIEGLEILESQKATQETTLEGMTKKYTAKLKAWFENNHIYFSGTLTQRGNAKIRIGHRVIYKDAGFEREFYVEGVSHSWNLYENFTTTLTLTRGQPIDTNVDHRNYLPKPPAKPPVKPVAKSKTPAKDTYYTVKKGDTLQSIAQKLYGKYDLWTRLWDANSKMLTARDKRNAVHQGRYIYPGQKLRVPPK